MRDYSKISPKFWIGATGKKLRTGGSDTQLVALYLLTCPHANMLGLFYLPIMYIAHETGLGIEGASKGLQGSIEAGFCQYDASTEMVWVEEMAVYQIAERLEAGDKRSKGVQNEYDDLPDNPYLAPFFDKYHTAFNMSKKRVFGLDLTSPFQAPSKPLPSQEQEQEHEQEQKHEQEHEHKTLPAAIAAGEENSETALQTACKETWKFYSDSYFNRYSIEPKRNPKVNSIVKQFVQRIGHEESPHVAAFYVSHNEQFYVKKTHPVELMLKDAEGLHTQWATGKTMTGTRARQIDQSQANYSVVDEAMKILEQTT